MKISDLIIGERYPIKDIIALEEEHKGISISWYQSGSNNCVIKGISKINNYKDAILYIGAHESGMISDLQLVIEEKIIKGLKLTGMIASN